MRVRKERGEGREIGRRRASEIHTGQDLSQSTSLSLTNVLANLSSSRRFFLLSLCQPTNNILTKNRRRNKEEKKERKEWVEKLTIKNNLAMD